LAINGATHLGQTWLTFTYVPGLMDASDARAVVEISEETLAAARREIV
jgi:hypothetical protein